jgi:hypothetical protein
VAALNKELDEKKSLIRDWASGEMKKLRALDPTLTMLEVPTREGTLSVVFPSDKPCLRAAATLDTLVENLKSSRVGLVAEQKWALSKDFKKNWLLGAFTKTEQKEILRVITFEPETPKVEPAK